MAKNKISEFSSTPGNNTDIAGINIAEGSAPSGINNAIRELMAQLKDQQTGSDGDGFTVGGVFTSSGGSVFSSGVTFSSSVVMTGTVSMDGTNNIGNTTSSTILSGSVTQTSSSKLYLDSSVTTSSLPPLSWSGDTNTGIYRPAENIIGLVTAGTDRLRIQSNGIVIGSGDGTTSPSGNILRSSSGSGTNVTGSDLEITAGNGTGTGGSGRIIIKTADVGSSGSSANTLTQRLLITPKGGFSFGTGATSYGTAGQVLKSNGDAPPTFGNLTDQTGTAPFYCARAWASFEYNGSVVINADGNVATITRTSTGLYTVTFTTAMPNANYAVIGSSHGSSGASSAVGQTFGVYDKTTTGFKINITDPSANNYDDPVECGFSVFR
jgi:hypothetical protein